MIVKGAVRRDGQLLKVSRWIVEPRLAGVDWLIERLLLVVNVQVQNRSPLIDVARCGDPAGRTGGFFLDFHKGQVQGAAENEFPVAGRRGLREEARIGGGRGRRVGHELEVVQGVVARVEDLLETSIELVRAHRGHGAAGGLEVALEGAAAGR